MYGMLKRCSSYESLLKSLWNWCLPIISDCFGHNVGALVYGQYFSRTNDCARDCREATDLLIYVLKNTQWESEENGLNVQ
jgi:hypothetical protein